MAYSIKDLEKLSGVQAHTIRIWEQRYGLLSPERSDTNIRSYSDLHARKMLNVATLIENGWKISKVAKLSKEQMNQEIQKIIETNDDVDFALVNKIVESGILFSEAAFEKAFSSCLLKHGMKGAYVKVLYPALVKVGFMWTSDQIVPVQEHFITNLIKQKLFSAIDGLTYPSDQAQTWLLFLPEGEHHELGLLMANYVLREYGHKVIYLGPNLPVSDLIKVMQGVDFSHLLMFAVVRKTFSVIQSTIEKLELAYKKSRLVVVGNFSTEDKIGASTETIFVNSFDEFVELNRVR